MIKRFNAAFIKACTFYSPTRGVAAILALGLIAWGVWVLIPGTAFISPVYALMLSLATEPVWGALFTFAGTTFLVGVITKDLEWIRRGAFLGFILWVIVAALGFVAEPGVPAVITRLIVALLHGWIYMQVKIHPDLITGEANTENLENYKLLKENNNDE